MREAISTPPPRDSMLRRTTSMPTPRPDTSVTSCAVENPASNSSCQTSESDASAGSERPRCAARARINSRSSPRPSSDTSITTLPPRWLAARLTVPVGGFPAATRTSGDSSPWSTELRTRCVSGSEIFSISPRSSSVVSPDVVNSTCLPSRADSSRTIRGNRANTSEIGTIRMARTACCRLRVCRARSVSPGWPACPACCSRPAPWRESIDSVITSSPTRFTNRSIFSVATRMECRALTGASAPCRVATGGIVATRAWIAPPVSSAADGVSAAGRVCLARLNSTGSTKSSFASPAASGHAGMTGAAFAAGAIAGAGALTAGAA